METAVMATTIPEEINVFTRPHGRMKELVNNFTRKMLHSDLGDVSSLLEVVGELHSTLLEFRRHEAIENVLILDRLKQRIHQHQQQPPPQLGHCHEDDALYKLFEVVRRCESSLGSSSLCLVPSDCSVVGGELHEAYTRFLKHFLPHMRQEELEFQPLLMSHFEYNELKALKDEVWQQHQNYSKFKTINSETSISLTTTQSPPPSITNTPSNSELQSNECSNEMNNNECDESYSSNELSDNNMSNSSRTFYPNNYSKCTPVDNRRFKEVSYNNDFSIERLPREVLSHILSYLNPQEVLRVASVSKSLNTVAYDGALWRHLYPTQWATGLWTWTDQHLAHGVEDKGNLSLYDEDCDVDTSEPQMFRDRLKDVMQGLVYGVCQRVGPSVRSIVLDGGGCVSPHTVNKMLSLCPSIEVLRAAYCTINYYAFKGLHQHSSLRQLKVMDLQGCETLDDKALKALAKCADGPSYALQTNEEPSYALQTINLSGCKRITDEGLEALITSRLVENISDADLSGCELLTPQCMNRFLQKCTALPYRNVAYCDNILKVVGEDVAMGCSNLCHPVKYCCRPPE